MAEEKKISSKIECPAAGTVTVRYADGTEKTVNTGYNYAYEIDDTDQQDLFSSEILSSGIDELTDSLKELRAKRLDAGECVHCGKKRDMTQYGLKDCSRCTK